MRGFRRPRLSGSPSHPPRRSPPEEDIDGISNLNCKAPSLSLPLRGKLPRSPCLPLCLVPRRLRRRPICIFCTVRRFPLDKLVRVSARFQDRLRASNPTFAIETSRRGPGRPLRRSYQYLAQFQNLVQSGREERTTRLLRFYCLTLTVPHANRRESEVNMQ